MDGPLFNVLLDSLEGADSIVRLTSAQNRKHVQKSERRTHHFRISAVDDDSSAVGGGGHLAGGARARGGARRGEAGPGECVQGERVNVVVIDKVSAGSRKTERDIFIDLNVS